MLDKINALEGPWLTRFYYKKILSMLYENEIRIARQETIMLTRLYDETYWGKLRSIHNIDLAVLDHRHWYYNDDIFHEYVKRVSSISFPAVCLFESPFGHERPDVDVLAFEKKLYERSKLMADAIHNKQPNSIIISPAIDLVSPEYKEKYLDYFLHNRSLFDAYALHLCYDMSEKNTGLLTSFLNQILSVLNKPVWITKWAIPSCQDRIISSSTVADSNWQPISYIAAAAKMKSIFHLIEQISHGRTRWFFASLDLDIYNRGDRTPGPGNFWNSSSFLNSFKQSHGWDFQHFMGISASGEEIKQPILDTLFELAKDHNGSSF